MVSFLVAAVALLGATASAASVHKDSKGHKNSMDSKDSPCGSKHIVDYEIKKGDTLGNIAGNFSSGICTIATLNNITNPNFILAGAGIKVPKDCKNPDNESCITGDATATCVLGVGSSYNVRGGDSLDGIAVDFNITAPALRAANPAVTDPNLIQAGQLLNVTVCPNSCCDMVATYNIKDGDRFVQIARKNHVTVGQLKSINGNVDDKNLQIGQEIIVPSKCRTPQ